MQNARSGQRGGTAARALGAAAALALAACASSGARPIDECKIRVVGVETWAQGSEGLDAAYRVKGSSGSSATVWLAAQNRTGTYVSGPGVSVGPGPFEAIVELKLTGEPKSFVAVLEVAGKRCRADANKP